DEDGMPWANRLTDAIRESTGLEHGVALPAWDAMITGNYPDLVTLAMDAAAGKVRFRIPAGQDAMRVRETSRRYEKKGFNIIDTRRAQREQMLATIGDPPKPWIYLIV